MKFIKLFRRPVLEVWLSSCMALGALNLYQGVASRGRCSGRVFGFNGDRWWTARFSNIDREQLVVLPIWFF